MSNSLGQKTTRKTADLRAALAQPGIIRVIGAYDGLSAMLGEKSGFDALWASGLCISAAHGVPDASILTMTEFVTAASIMNQATTIPVIADCDTGFGEVNNVIRMVRQYEQAGVAAVCIEDKTFPKRNSLLEGRQQLADPCEFSAKILAAKQAQMDPDFMIIARLESLNVGAGLEDALQRAELYCAAGADAILVHSKAKTAIEVLEFAAAWRQQSRSTPLVVVPTTYFGVTVDELHSHGIKMVIYANQALRAAIRAMDNVMVAIRQTGTSAPIEELLTSCEELFALLGTDEIDATVAWFDDVVLQTRANNAIKEGKLRNA